MNFYYTVEFDLLISEKYKTGGAYTGKPWPADAVPCTAEEVNIFRGITLPASTGLGPVAGRPARADVPPSMQTEVIATAEDERQRLIVSVDATMLDWRTELIFDEISGVNRAKLSTWLAYKNKVKSIPAEEAIIAEFDRPDQPAQECSNYREVQAIRVLLYQRTSNSTYSSARLSSRRLPQSSLLSCQQRIVTRLFHYQPPNGVTPSQLQRRQFAPQLLELKGSSLPAPIF